jgi:hypothetical protein
MDANNFSNAGFFCSLCAVNAERPKSPKQEFRIARPVKYLEMATLLAKDENEKKSDADYVMGRSEDKTFFIRMISAGTLIISTVSTKNKILFLPTRFFTIHQITKHCSGFRSDVLIDINAWKNSP